MTGCDLIAASKPWPVHTEAVKIIFEEFYEQASSFIFIIFFGIHQFGMKTWCILRVIKAFK